MAGKLLDAAGARNATAATSPTSATAATAAKPAAWARNTGSRERRFAPTPVVVWKLVVLVSVIIPTFDRRAFVLEAIQSVLAQDHAHFETIVVDDGSTDGTADAVDAAFGERVLVIRTGNRGVSAARNLGVSRSRGDVIAFLDSDDLWLPGKLAEQARFFAARPRAEICQTQELWVRNGARVNPRQRHRKPDGDVFAPSLRLCLVSPSAVAMRRRLFDRVGGFDESLPACEDYDLWLRIACDTPIHLIDRPLVVKRGGHADQLSRRDWGMDRYRVAALDKLLRSGRLGKTQHDDTVSVLAEKCAVLAGGADRRGRREEADAYRRLAAQWLSRAATRPFTPSDPEAHPGTPRRFANAAGTGSASLGPT